MTRQEVAATLEASGRSHAGLLRGLPAAVATWHPAEGEWCVNECAGHVLEAEKRGFAGRIRTILGADEPDVPGWDRVAIARARNDCAKAPGAIADEFDQVRGESVDLIRSLRPEQLERGGNHPDVGRLTVNDLLHEWVHHDGNHLRHALANVQAYVWPSMGNARRFSQP